MKNSVIQIVPFLPPFSSGVGDYAVGVGSLMRSKWGVDTYFVTSDERSKVSDVVEGFRLKTISVRSEESLVGTLEAVTSEVGASGILLQLSSYGFSVRGCPLWLVCGLRAWKRRHPKSPLVTMFHELYASGPPWSSAFWLRPMQKAVITGILKESNVAITNTHLYQRFLEGQDSRKIGRIEVMPIPSNLGEPTATRNLNDRSKGLVIFGLPSSRRRAYKTKTSVIRAACEYLSIEKIHDVGSTFESIPEEFGGIPVTRHGFLKFAELGSLLADSVAGIVAYPRAFLEKSGVFAAYCAYGLLPVVPLLPSTLDSVSNSLEDGVHYLSFNRGISPDGNSAQEIANRAREWYEGHSMDCHARTLINAMF